MLTISCLLSLEQCKMIELVCFLPIPQSETSILHMLTSSLQRLAIATLRGTQKKSAAQGWGAIWVRHEEHAYGGGAYAAAGVSHRWEATSRGAWVGFLWSLQSGRTCLPLMPPTALAAEISAPVLQQPQYSGWVQNQVSHFAARLSCTHTHFYPWEKLQAKKFSPELYHLEL